MPLKSIAGGKVSFQVGVKFEMVDERGRTILVALEADVLDFFEPKIADDDIACFLRHRDRIERVASELYDKGALDNGQVLVAYGDLKRL